MGTGRSLLRSQTALRWLYDQTAPVAGHRKRRRHNGRRTPDLSENGGGRGIRTPVTRKGKAVFKTAAINRSAIPPHAVPTE